MSDQQLRSDAVWTKAAELSAIPDPGMAAFDVGAERVVIARAGATVYAVEDRCSHDDGPLSDGSIEGTEILCPRHGARFDLRTGDATRMPASAPVRVFPVKIEGGAVLVDLGSG